jgi:hypothetical protein
MNGRPSPCSRKWQTTTLLVIPYCLSTDISVVLPTLVCTTYLITYISLLYYCLLLPDKSDYMLQLGFIIAWFYVYNIVSRPLALSEWTTEDYQELHEACIWCVIYISVASVVITYYYMFYYCSLPQLIYYCYCCCRYNFCSLEARYVHGGVQDPEHLRYSAVLS